MKLNTLLGLVVLSVFSCGKPISEPTGLNILPLDSDADVILSINAPVMPTRSHFRQKTKLGDYYIRLSRKGDVTAVNLVNNDVRVYRAYDEGPFAISYPCSVVLNDFGGATVFGADMAVKIDSTGTSIERFTFGSSTSEVAPPSGYFMPMDPSYPIANDGDKVYLNLIKEGADQFSFPFVYEGSAVGEIDLKNKTARSLNIPHDHRGVFYGGLHKENLKYFEGKLYVTFEFSPNIYIYDLNENETTIIEQPSVFGQANQPFTGSSDPMLMIQHMSLNMAYGPLLFEEDGDYVYQTLLAPSLDKPGKTRVGAVRKFTKYFKLLKEGRLPKYSVPSNAYVAKGNLHFEYGRASLGENSIYYRTLN